MSPIGTSVNGPVRSRSGIDRFTFRAPSLRGLLHEVLHAEPFGESGEISRARLKTVRPSNSSRIPAHAHKPEFRNWSGARDLNPGPPRPQPGRGRVLQCPADSVVVLANTKSTRLVSFGDPEDPA